MEILTTSISNGKRQMNLRLNAKGRSPSDKQAQDDGKKLATFLGNVPGITLKAAIAQFVKNYGEVDYLKGLTQIVDKALPADLDKRWTRQGTQDKLSSTTWFVQDGKVMLASPNKALPYHIGRSSSWPTLASFVLAIREGRVVLANESLYAARYNKGVIDGEWAPTSSVSGRSLYRVANGIVTLLDSSGGSLGPSTDFTLDTFRKAIDAGKYRRVAGSTAPQTAEPVRRSSSC